MATANEAAPAAPTTGDSDKNIILTALLAFFFGIFGAHRFYAGKPVSAVIQLLTIGGLGIWSFIDFLIILFGQFTDSSGRKITWG